MWRKIQGNPHQGRTTPRQLRQLPPQAERRKLERKSVNTWKKVIYRNCRKTKPPTTYSNVGTTSYQCKQYNQTDSKNLLFDYITNHCIGNEDHYNAHLKYQELITLERNIAVGRLSRVKLTAFNQALQADERISYSDRVIRECPKMYLVTLVRISNLCAHKDNI